jgi:GNAT superfamily N-acetyltransferase
MAWQRVEHPAQIAAVAALAQEIWTRHYTPIIGTAQVQYMLAKFQNEAAIQRQIFHEGYEYYLAPAEAYLALVPDTLAGTMLLSKIYVKEEFRGRGLGRGLVALAERRCQELGCRELWLTVNRRNAGAIAFYEQAGFRITGPLVTDIGGGYVMDDWRMAKVVGASG